MCLREYVCVCVCVCVCPCVRACVCCLILCSYHSCIPGSAAIRGLLWWPPGVCLHPCRLLRRNSHQPVVSGRSVCMCTCIADTVPGTKHTAR